VNKQKAYYLTHATNKYDIAIIGATPGGITCAVRAAREGLSVLLTCWNAHPGGFFVNGGNFFDTLYEGNRAPLVAEFLTLNREYNREYYGEESDQYKKCFFGDRLASSSRPIIFNDAARWVFERWIEDESGIALMLNTIPGEVGVEDRHIKSIVLKSNGDGKSTQIFAKIFVDATYEGDLAALSGIDYHVGREAREDFGELHAGKIFTWRGEEAAHPREAALGLLNLRTFRLTSKQIVAGSTGEGDRAIQAYNFRMQLTRDPAKRREIQKPDTYDRSCYIGIAQDEMEMLRGRYPIKSDALYCGPDKIAMNGQNHCFPGGNHDYPEADEDTRKAIIKAHVDHMLGYFYFIQHDESIPEKTRVRNQQFGLDKTLYLDNNNIPYEIYVREARRIRGRYIFREQDATIAPGINRTPVHHDAIAIAEWPMDSHDCTTEIRPGSLHDGVLLLTEETRPSQVPFRTLLPKNLDNLLVPICLSATHIGLGTLRVEPTWMHICESAAYVATLAITNKLAVSDVPIEMLQKKLVKKNIMLSFFNEFDMDTDAPWAKAIQYFGTKGFFSSYNAYPDKPLTKEIAYLWIEAVHSIKQGNHDSQSFAQQIAKQEAIEDNPMSKEQFEIRIHEAIGWTPQVTHEPEVQNKTGQTPILRKDACTVLYDSI